MIKINMSHLVVVFASLSLYLVGHVDAGFSVEVCDSMNPTDHASVLPSPVLTKSTSKSPVTIHVKEPYYKPNSHVVVSLVGGPFDQFILQARKLGLQNSITPKRLGHFLKPLPNNTEFLNCDEKNPQSVVTHSLNADTTNELTFEWKAPRNDEGSLEFIATVVNGDEYWEQLKSVSVNFRIFPPDLSDCGKTVGCFVHGMTNETKSGGEPLDVIVKSDVTGDGKIATFIMGRKTPKGDGYVGIAFADDKDKMEDVVMIACIKHFNTFIINSYYMKEKASGFENTSTYISAKMHKINDDMMWCKFQFHVENTYPVKKDLSKPKYRLYFTGDLDENDVPLLPMSDKIMMSEEPMMLNDNKFIKITHSSKDNGSVSVLCASSISCILSLLLLFLLH